MSLEACALVARQVMVDVVIQQMARCRSHEESLRYRWLCRRLLQSFAQTFAGQPQVCLDRVGANAKHLPDLRGREALTRAEIKHFALTRGQSLEGVQGPPQLLALG